MTFVDWADLHRWKMINKALDLPFDEPQETYSTSEHLFHDLGIPAGTKGRIVDPAPRRAPSRARTTPRAPGDRSARAAAPRSRTRSRPRTARWPSRSAAGDGRAPRPPPPPAAADGARASGRRPGPAAVARRRRSAGLVQRVLTRRQATTTTLVPIGREVPQRDRVGRATAGCSRATAACPAGAAVCSGHAVARSGCCGSRSPRRSGPG